MTRKRWLLLGSLTLGIVAAVLVVLALLPPRPGITKENLDRIQIGMTQAEVEAIFGTPASGNGPRGGVHVWRNNFSLAIIVCDTEGTVVRTEWDGWPDEPTHMEKLLDKLLRRERRKAL